MPTDRGVRAGTAGGCAVLFAVLFAVLLALVWAGWAPLLRLDRVTENRINSYVANHGWAVHVAGGISLVGEPLAFEAVALVVAAVELARRRGRTAVALVAAVVTQWVLGHLGKLVVGRPRPTVPHPVAHVAGSSFPSGHALGAAATMTTLVLLTGTRPGPARRAWCAVGVVLVLLVGLSRTALSVHYPSDVLGGWLLGLSIGFAAAAFAPRTVRW